MFCELYMHYCRRRIDRKVCVGGERERERERKEGGKMEREENTIKTPGIFYICSFLYISFCSSS